MTQWEIADKANELVDMLMEHSVDKQEIADRLSLGSYEQAFLGLGWLYPDEDEDE